MKLNYSLSIAALMAIAVSTGFAQTKPKAPAKTKVVTAAASKKEDLLPIDPAVIIGKLPNGLTYYIRKNSQPKNRAELYLVNKAGSVLESDAQQGLAHFTEHMAFKGTRDFPKKELINYLEKSGVKFGADLNAYTSFDETVYQLPLPTDSAKIFETGLNILANWAGYVSFDTDQIDTERGVVLEESRLRGKNAQERLSHMIYPIIFNNSRYAERIPIGKEDILKTFKPEVIKSFYHDWYRPDLQAVIAVGDFDPKHVEELIRKDFSALKNPANERPRTKYNVALSPGTKVKIVTDKELPYTIAEVIVKHPGAPIRTKEDYIRALQIALFNSMMGNRLSELTQKADPPFLFAQANYGSFLGGLNAFTTIAVAKPGELQKAITAAVEETERARKFGFTESELDRAKQNALTGIENAYKEKDKTRSINFVNEYQQNFLKGEGIPGIEYEYNFYKENLGKIKLSDVNALTGKFISNQSRDIIVEAPEKEKDKLPAEATLQGWVDGAGKNVTAYVDNVSKKPLLEKIPAGTKVVSEHKDPAIGTTALVLGNGVKVILKPTDFKNDQILINGYSFGGTSLAPDADFPSDNMADDIVGSSGIADMTEIQLGKMLAGKNLSISPYISETSQGINGSSSPKDLETALQLIYLYYTQPRKDADIWQSNLTQIKASLANKGLDPASVFQDTVNAVMSNYNFRRMSVTLDQVNHASLDKAFDFYKDRFADASTTTFILTGSFDVEKIKPLLEQYLGGLPSAKRSETYKNLHIAPPAGQITKTVYKGIGDKATVQLAYTGEYTYNEANNIQVDALGAILQFRMLDRLRQKESGVYSPGVSANYSKLPNGRYSVTIFFGCAPANVDKLIAAAIDEIDKIKQNGPEATDIQKFVAEQKRSIEVNMRENRYWQTYLTRTAQYETDPDAVLNLTKNLDQVTAQSVKDAANKYLSSNLIKLILVPEKK
ncbi:peptidase M16 [Mucilaginibacter sp. PPCGB 2223]|uniref:M16 family metallopeptidase n=1 Tax=Mucilaginibacter sp. PPCGB 2223 TaxID=1886027 RepID=UPI000826564C|nr:M16 family metallopeptidase [Mucilaginibacter sp. PPCGB 2223]OCX51194.1 peptidase M16 [Mucilaginibacter sp. PPCGB 2223]